MYLEREWRLCLLFEEEVELDWAAAEARKPAERRELSCIST